MRQKIYKLSQIKEMVNKINENLGVPNSKLPAYGSGDDKRPSYVTANKDSYSLFEYNPYHDKKNQHLTIKTSDINELLFKIFEEATRTMASNYELENRIPNQDTRIIMFNKHIEILHSLPLKKEFIDKLNDYYDYLLQLKKPEPIPEKW